MNHQNRDLDFWEYVVEKTVEEEVNVTLQSYSRRREIDSKDQWGNCLSLKKNKKHETAQNDRARSHSSLTNTNQTKTQTPACKKNKCQGKYWGHLATKVSTTKVSKKNKDKDKNKKDMSHIKCHACKEKSHYANKCRKKLKI